MCARRVKLSAQPSACFSVHACISHLPLECARLVCIMCMWSQEEGACSFSSEGNLNLPSCCSAFIIAPNWFLVIELFCGCGVREYVSPKVAELTRYVSHATLTLHSAATAAGVTMGWRVVMLTHSTHLLTYSHLLLTSYCLLPRMYLFTRTLLAYCTLPCRVYSLCASPWKSGLPGDPGAFPFTLADACR